MKHYQKLVCIYAFLALFVAACGPVIIDKPEEIIDPEDRLQERVTGGTKFFGDAGILSLGGADRGGDTSGTSGIGVNAFLWRASLDAISFMPIAQVDPFGGVILTDWYSDPQLLDERFKVNIFILSSALKADAIRVSAFKQIRVEGEWLETAVDNATIVEIEDNILSRAREYKIVSAE